MLITNLCRATEQPPADAKEAASWANVAKLVDLSDKGRKSEKDTSKYKYGIS